jgi:hypothetical protein
MRTFQFLITATLLAISLSAISAEKKYVAVQTANVRATPDGVVLDRIRQGTEVEVHARSGNWFRISASNLSPRWIHSSALCSAPNCWLRSSAPLRENSYAPTGSSRPKPTRHSRPSSSPRNNFNNNSSCPCSGGHVCVGPRGGRYCITSGGNKRYGV